jgi:heme oxygenase
MRDSDRRAERTDQVRERWEATGVCARLRADTRSVHRRLEDELDLVGPDLTVGRYRSVLERFHGYYTVLEPRLDSWHRADPLLDWPRRRKVELLRADLAVLGVDACSLPVCPRVPDLPGTAEALGALYVVEGATLGGQVIVRTLRSGARVPLAATGFLGSYGPEVGRLWRDWRRCTERWVGDDVDRADDVVAHALRTFATLREWLAPARRDVAA